MIFHSVLLANQDASAMHKISMSKRAHRLQNSDKTSEKLFTCDIHVHMKLAKAKYQGNIMH